MLFFGCDECKTIFDFVVQMFNTATKNTPSAGPTDKEMGARRIYKIPTPEIVPTNEYDDDPVLPRGLVPDAATILA